MSEIVTVSRYKIILEKVKKYGLQINSTHERIYLNDSGGLCLGAFFDYTSLYFYMCGYESGRETDPEWVRKLNKKKRVK